MYAEASYTTAFYENFSWNSTPIRIGSDRFGLSCCADQSFRLFSHASLPALRSVLDHCRSTCCDFRLKSWGHLIDILPLEVKTCLIYTCLPSSSISFSRSCDQRNACGRSYAGKRPQAAEAALAISTLAHESLINGVQLPYRISFTASCTRFATNRTSCVRSEHLFVTKRFRCSAHFSRDTRRCAPGSVGLGSHVGLANGGPTDVGRQTFPHFETATCSMQRCWPASCIYCHSSTSFISLTSSSGHLSRSRSRSPALSDA